MRGARIPAVVTPFFCDIVNIGWHIFLIILLQICPVLHTSIIHIWLDLEAEGSICKMGGRNTPEELKEAAEEIAKGAKFAAEINNMNLSYTRTF